MKLKLIEERYMGERGGRRLHDRLYQVLDGSGWMVLLDGAADETEAHLSRHPTEEGARTRFAKRAGLAQPPPEAHLVSTQRAAELLGVSPRTTRRWAEAGLGHKVGRNWVMELSVVTGKARSLDALVDYLERLGPKLVHRVSPVWLPTFGGERPELPAELGEVLSWDKRRALVGTKGLVGTLHLVELPRTRRRRPKTRPIQALVSHARLSSPGPG